MNSSNILAIVTFVYGLAACMYVAAWVFKKETLGRTAWWIAALAVAGNTAGIGLRWVESYRMGIGHAPLSNMYESLVFFAWTIGFVYLVLERRYKSTIVGVFATPLAFLAIAYASLSPNINDRIQPLIPALKSNWLIAHVITCFFGYAAFAIAFGLSFMFLLRVKSEASPGALIERLPSSQVLDELTYRMIMFGFLFLSIGIITGAVWANSAWGSYWSWDPKETWSLITWFIYATLLHARNMRGWHGKRIAYLSILGFLAVLFTYFGVNYLPGLHSYSQS
jgi:cytochrome c-type biogenesis protein CcsB